MGKLGTATLIAAALLFVSQPISGEIPDPDCWWKFDEGGGQFASDSIGGMDGVLGETTAEEIYDPQWLWYDENRQYVLIFNRGQQVRVPHNSVFDFMPDDAFSVSFWVLTTEEIGQTMLGKGYACALPEYNFHFLDSDTLGLVFDSFGGGMVRASNPLPSTRWSHVVATFAPWGDLVLYVDGREVARGENYSLGWPTDGPLTIGKSGNCVGFRGLMDDVRLWRKTLEVEEILELALFFTDGFESGDTSAWSGTVP